MVVKGLVKGSKSKAVGFHNRNFPINLSSIKKNCLFCLLTQSIVLKWTLMGFWAMSRIVKKKKSIVEFATRCCTCCASRFRHVLHVAVAGTGDGSDWQKPQHWHIVFSVDNPKSCGVSVRPLSFLFLTMYFICSLPIILQLSSPMLLNICCHNMKYTKANPHVIFFYIKKKKPNNFSIISVDPWLWSHLQWWNLTGGLGIQDIFYLHAWKCFSCIDLLYSLKCSGRCLVDLWNIWPSWALEAEEILQRIV